MTETSHIKCLENTGISTIHVCDAVSSHININIDCIFILIHLNTATKSLWICLREVNNYLYQHVMVFFKLFVFDSIYPTNSCLMLYR